MGEVSIPIENFMLSGAFTTDGVELAGGTLSGLFDTRPMAVFFEADGHGEDICELLSLFDADCVPCADGEPYCTPIALEDILGVEVPESTLLEIEEDHCHPLCEYNWVNPDCDL